MEYRKYHPDPDPEIESVLVKQTVTEENMIKIRTLLEKYRPKEMHTKFDEFYTELYQYLKANGFKVLEIERTEYLQIDLTKPPEGRDY